MSKPKPKQPYMDKAFQTALDRIAVIQTYIRATHYASDGLAALQGGRVSEQHGAAFRTLREPLYEHLMDAYRQLLLWAVTDPDKYLRKAQAEAWRYFLKKDAGIMAYLDLHGQAPSMWLSEEERAFREEVEAAKGKAVKAKKRGGPRR